MERGDSFLCLRTPPPPSPGDRSRKTLILSYGTHPLGDRTCMDGTVGGGKRGGFLFFFFLRSIKADWKTTRGEFLGYETHGKEGRFFLILREIYRGIDNSLCFSGLKLNKTFPDPPPLWMIKKTNLLFFGFTSLKPPDYKLPTHFPLSYISHHIFFHTLNFSLIEKKKNTQIRPVFYCAW